MRIAFLCKRKYMGKDVIVDRYARLYEIPLQLARLGHSIECFCLSYQGADEGNWEHEANPGHLRWNSASLGSTILPRMLHYPIALLAKLRVFSPHIIIGASDIPHVALAAWLAKRLRVPYAVDLYDNFESFGQARIPGMKYLLRRAVCRAALVTTTSEPLTELIRDDYHAGGEIISMPSTVDKKVFQPMDRVQCRGALGLPLHARMVGTAGGLHQTKGVGTLYEAWKILAEENPNLHLVLAGPLDGKLDPPKHERVHYLGQIPHALTAQLFNALDVGVIYLRDTPFGRYCFPQKAYEMAACSICFVAAEVGAIGSILREYPESLYQADDAEALAKCIRQQLMSPQPPQLRIDDWTQLISALEPRLLRIVSRARL
jgi:teichuronic acid biosynthesis glycosyltransferase TuaC